MFAMMRTAISPRLAMSIFENIFFLSDRRGGRG